MDIYLNGNMAGEQAAHIRHDDAGLQHGVGLFETMAACHGRAFRLDEHLQRLLASAAELGLGQSLDIDQLRRAVQTTLAHNQLDEARLRLTVTGGSLSLLRNEPEADHQPTILAVATDPIACDEEYFKKGVTVQIAPQAANPFEPTAGHKTLAYWGRLRLLRQAASVGAAEAILLNISNHLASGCVSNLFLVKRNNLLTPIARGEEVRGALPAPVLPGITRDVVVELAQVRDIAVEKRMLTIDDLLDADEVFLTNSSWQLLPVTAVEKKTIGDGEVGPVSTDLRSGLLELIESETTQE